MPAWVALAIGAAFLQNLRSALQKALTRGSGVLGATYARFLFAAPWAVCSSRRWPAAGRRAAAASRRASSPGR